MTRQRRFIRGYVTSSLCKMRGRKKRWKQFLQVKSSNRKSLQSTSSSTLTLSFASSATQAPPSSSWSATATRKTPRSRFRLRPQGGLAPTRLTTASRCRPETWRCTSSRPHCCPNPSAGCPITSQVSLSSSSVSSSQWSVKVLQQKTSL